VRTRLAAWRDNDSAVAQMAARSYLLQEVVPLSRDVRALAEAGLEALDAIEAGTPLRADRLSVLREHLAPYQQAAAASTSVVGALMSPQPAHGLRIPIVEGITELVEAAAPPVSR
jgi:hexosaminidase